MFIFLFDNFLRVQTVACSLILRASKKRNLNGKKKTCKVEYIEEENKVKRRNVKKIGNVGDKESSRGEK